MKEEKGKEVIFNEIVGIDNMIEISEEDEKKLRKSNELEEK